MNSMNCFVVRQLEIDRRREVILWRLSLTEQFAIARQKEPNSHGGYFDYNWQLQY